MIYTIKNDFLAVEISSRGADILSIKSLDGNKDYIWDGKKFWFKHAPLLFPICGATTDPYTYRGKEYRMEKHGFISKYEFALESVDESSVVLVAKENEETLAQYPFSFEFTARYSLDGKKLVSEYTVKNTSSEVMPYMFGLHPAFILHGDAPKESFCIDFGEELLAGQNKILSGVISQTPTDRVIPDGKLYLSDEIYNLDTIILSRVPKSIDFVSPYGKVFNMKWSDNFNYLCVWKWPDDAARYICIEPWTHIPSERKCTDDLDTKSAYRLGIGECDEYSYTVDFT